MLPMLGTNRSYEQMAAALGCSDSTVGRDVQAIRGQWRVRYAETYESFQAEEMAKLDIVEWELLADVLERDENGRVRLPAVDRNPLPGSSTRSNRRRPSCLAHPH